MEMLFQIPSGSRETCTWDWPIPGKTMRLLNKKESERGYKSHVSWMCFFVLREHF